MTDASPLTADAQHIVFEHYDLDLASVSPFGGGIINATYLVEAAGKRYLLQKLHPMFLPAINTDFAIVTNHLRDNGWEAPELIETKAGNTYVATTDAVWRMMSFIPSDASRPTELSSTDYHNLGRMLGQFHATLATLDYTPTYTIPHFHDTAYYAERLQGLVASLPDAESRQFAVDMLTALEKLPTIPMSEPQIIHGDPQTSNTLFRDGMPLTFIDYDTIMRAPIWVDLGDMLRSLAEDVVENAAEFPAERLRIVAEGYREAAAPNVLSDEFFGWSLIALQKLALELGIRFVTDLAPGESYFGFDTAKFNSRIESDRHRGEVQWKLYNAARMVKEL